MEALYHLAAYKMEDADADWSEIAAMLEHAAESGNEAAVLKLAHCYLEGKGTEQKVDEAIATLKKWLIKVMVKLCTNLVCFTLMVNMQR